MIEHGHSEFGLGFDFAIQCVILIVLLAIAADRYPQIVR